MRNLWRKGSYLEKFISGWWKLIKGERILKKYSKWLKGTQKK
jgi:hypothetical protein